MRLRHVSILKALEGEFKALENLDESTANRFLPLFEVGRLTENLLQDRKYLRLSTTPTTTYLDRILEKAGKAWPSRIAMVDGYQWPPDAHVENGEHVIAYMVSKLRSTGVSVIPVVGYDRWGQLEYQLGLQSIPARQDGHYCLRLDHSAIEDAAEPDVFEETIFDIIEKLELDPTNCSVMIDFSDISTDASPLEFIASNASTIIRQLEKFNFRYYTIAGCSLPNTINLAVEDRDSTGSVLRKEFLAWQTLRLTFPKTAIINGDYGVRGPTTLEIRNKYVNGKIRYTINGSTFVLRGHPFRNDGGNYQQLHNLAAALVNSPHFLGANFSWGDNQISKCRNFEILGNLSQWIAIDTNHHLTFVAHEIEEFERDVMKKSESEEVDI